MIKQKSKTNTFIEKTNQLLADPRYKELERIPLEKIKVDKERTQRQYHQVQKELAAIKEEFSKTTKRAEDRENELRNNINTLLVKYRIKDPEITIASMNELYSQIISNVQTLEEQNNQNIIDKKEEMEERIQMRLIDSDINYYKELDKKVQEQKGILRALHEFTIDMHNINSNYAAIKSKTECYYRENDLIKQELIRLDNSNDEMKTEIMRLKHINQKLEDKLNANKQMNKKNTMLNRKDIKNLKKKSQPMFLSASTSTGTLFRRQGYSSDITIEKINDLLFNKEFEFKYPREYSVLSQLMDTYDKITKKIGNLDNEYEVLSQKHPVYDRLFDILNKQLKKEENDEILSNKRKVSIEEVLGNFSVTMKKDQRMEYIESIVSDSEIHKLVYYQRFPNILNIDRQLG